MNNGFNQTTRKVSYKCKLGQIEVNSFSSCQQQQLLDNSLDHQARASCETEPFGRKLTFKIKNDNYSAAELKDFEKFLFCCKIIKYLPQARVKCAITNSINIILILEMLNLSPCVITGHHRNYMLFWTQNLRTCWDMVSYSPAYLNGEVFVF